MTATLNVPGSAATVLTTAHGAVYELGMTETGHGIPISDGLPLGQPDPAQK